MKKKGMRRIALPFYTALFFCVLFLCVLASPASLTARARASISNDYIAVHVDRETGRFTIRTTGGSPAAPNDSNVALLFDANPPTSYASIAFDGGRDVQIFGSRAGTFIREPYVTDNNNAIISEWRYRDYDVRQIFTLMKSADSGLEDCVKITYNIQNNSPRQESIGIRILLDTALSDLDNVPFRVPGFGLIDSEYEFSGEDVPLSWYSFDNYTRPNVRTVGALRGEGLLPPDRLIFAAWRRFSTNDWNFRVVRGRSFRFSVLGSKDSAVALVYECRLVNPGTTFTVATAYGLYGVEEQVIADNLAVTLRSADIIDDLQPFEFTATIRNVSTVRLTNFGVRLELPTNFMIVPSGRALQENAVYMQEFRGGQEVSLRWDLRALEGVRGDYRIRVFVDGMAGSTMHENSPAKTVHVTPPDDRRSLGAGFFNALMVRAGAPEMMVPVTITTNIVIGPTRFLEAINIIDPIPGVTNTIGLIRDRPPINFFENDEIPAGDDTVNGSADEGRRALQARLTEASLKARSLEEKMLVSEFRRIESMIERASMNLRNQTANETEIAVDIRELEEFLDAIAGRL
jgi:hypothetical protein